jgi:hypothetical protein
MNDAMTYLSGPSDNLGAGWDVMHVIRKRDGVMVETFVIGRDAGGKFMRKLDSYPEKWEVLTEERDLRICRQHFDSRDELRTEKATSALA